MADVATVTTDDVITEVAYWPSWPTHPYLDDLARGLRDLGIESSPLTAPRLVTRGATILHIHWPELLCSGLSRFNVVVRTLGRAGRVSKVAAAIAIHKLRRQPVVVTLHNLRPHEPPIRLPVLALRLVARVADAVIVLSPGSMRRARARYPELERTTMVVVPHMDWGDRYPVLDGDDTRRRLGIPNGAEVLAFFGQVRPYKGLEDLAAAFVELLDPGMHLLILGAGELSDRRLADAFRGDDRVHWQDGYQSDVEVARTLAAADLVVLPFRHIENSGSAIAALTMGLPVLVPALEQMRELAEEFGADRLAMYEGALTPAKLKAALESRRRSRDRPSVPSRDLTAVAARTKDVYDLATRRARRTHR